MRGNCASLRVASSRRNLASPRLASPCDAACRLALLCACRCASPCDAACCCPTVYQRADPGVDATWTLRASQRVTTCHRASQRVATGLGEVLRVPPRRLASPWVACVALGCLAALRVAARRLASPCVALRRSLGTLELSHDLPIHLQHSVPSQPPVHCAMKPHELIPRHLIKYIIRWKPYPRWDLAWIAC